MNDEPQGAPESQEPPEPEEPAAPEPFRWTERRAASMISMVASGAVVIADLALLVMFLRVASNLPGGWTPYWYIPAGIAAVFLYALRRFLKQVGQFRQDQ